MTSCVSRPLYSNLTHHQTQHSGDFESMLLKATRPDDQRPPPEFIGAILDATATFHRDEDVTSNR